MSFCNKCGTKVKDEAKHCNKCGGKVKQIAAHKESEHKSKTDQKGHCEKCGAKLAQSEKFCGECGTSSTSEGSAFLQNVPPHLKPWYILGGVLIIAAILLLPTKIESYQVDVPYFAKEQYNVEVPYEEIEEYVVQEQYEVPKQDIVSIPIPKQFDYKIEFVKCTGSIPLIRPGESTYELTNFESEKGKFTVTVGYTDDSDQKFSETYSQTVSAHSTATFTYSPTQGSFKNCWQRVDSIPTKTEYKDTIKQTTDTLSRDVTKYRTIQKTRTEVREREVQKIKSETRYKNINWLFGFEIPWKFP